MDPHTNAVNFRDNATFVDADPAEIPGEDSRDFLRPGHGGEIEIHAPQIVEEP